IPAARSYHQQITGVPSGFAFVVDDFGFDGRDADGALLMTGGPGYDAHVLRDGTFDPAWAGTAQLTEQVRQASAAAADQPVRWVFAERAAAEAMSKLLAANRISGIDVVTVPAAG
ncbi:hypothetical protein GORHZ_168_00010, partial [Gordonia rhizosphera NBRC 16068]